MNMKWKTLKLGAICSSVCSGGTPKSTNKAYYTGGNIPWLNTKEVNFNRIHDTEKYITELGLKNSSAKWIDKNCVIVAMYGATAGRVAISKIKLTTNQACCNLSIDENQADYNFVYYVLCLNYENLLSMANGGAQQNLNAQQIKDFEIPLPPLSTQKKIARVLGALDDKIELNNQINHNLEEQAKVLFKSWFVDFEPFGGKMPDDWEVSSLDKIANYLNGLAMQKFRPRHAESPLPVLKIKELRQGFCDKDSDLCTPNLDEDYIVRDGDVVFSWSGTLLVDFWTGGNCGLNQHLFKVTSDTHDKWFYYSWTQHHLSRFVAIAADKATTMGHIKRDNLQKAEVWVPASNDYKKLACQISPLYNKIVQNRLENVRLAQLRDTLLPKLMSGELDIEKV